MVKNTLLFLIASVVLVSCSQKHESMFKDEVTLELKGHIVIPIDSTTKRTTKLIRYNHTENRICLYNEVNHALQFYDFENGNAVHKIQLVKQGPDGVSNVDKMIFHNKDSIFVYNSVRYEIALLNNKGEIKEKFKILDLDRGDPTVSLMYEFMYMDEGKLYVIVRPTNTTNASNKRIVLEYDLSNRSKKFMMATPDSYYKGKWGDRAFHRNAAYNHQKNQIVLSLPFDESVYVFDIATEKIEKYFAHSSLMHKTKPLPRRYSGDTQMMLYYQLSNSWYGQILYDPHLNIYVRTGQVGLNIKPNDPVMGVRHPSKNNDGVYNVSVILDEHFRKIGEVPHMSFNSTIFSNEDGIYIPDNLYERENEDILVFAQYQLRRLKE